LTLVVALCAAATFGFAQTPGFSGVWVYDATKSVSPYSTPLGLQLTVAADSKQVSVTRVRNPKNPATADKYTCTLDGAPTRTMHGDDPVTWTLHRDGNVLVWTAERLVKARNATAKWTERWSLSPDGNTLTIDRVYSVPPEVARENPETGRIRETFTRQPSRGR
jgi:hypothetical protein